MYSFMWPVYICIHLYAFTFLARLSLAFNTSLSFVSAQPMLASAMRPDMLQTPGFVMSDLVIRIVYGNLNQSHLGLQRCP